MLKRQAARTHAVCLLVTDRRHSTARMIASFAAVFSRESFA